MVAGAWNHVVDVSASASAPKKLTFHPAVNTLFYKAVARKRKSPRPPHHVQEGFGLPAEEKYTMNVRSSCGYGGIALKGFQPPGQKKFISRAVRHVPTIP